MPDSLVRGSLEHVCFGNRATIKAVILTLSEAEGEGPLYLSEVMLHMISVTTLDL